MIDRMHKTIVAVSSAPGHAAVGIVRLSGDESLRIVGRLFASESGRPLADCPSWARVSGEVCIGGDLSLPAFAYLFRGPRSYTRQDVVELHTVGAPVALERVRTLAIQAGALPAQPGEFTARAFLNGAMDLAQAESVAGAIRAESDTQLRAVRRRMDGALTAAVRAARDGLAELLALVEADIDFAEEPIEFITVADLHARLSQLHRELAELRAGALSAERVDVLPRILLLGPPNAGKSWLMNRLSGVTRSIISAVAGTTRDILSAPIQLGRGEAVLLDSAGVDDAPDDVIARARAMALETATTVDLVCVVFDVTATDPRRAMALLESLDRSSVVIAANKCDLLDARSTEEAIARWAHDGWGRVHQVSALSGRGIDELREALAEALGARAVTASADALVLTQRERAAIAHAEEAIHRAGELAATATETVDCADVLALELREAMDALGEVTGEVTTEELLGRVFARFCIGK